MTRTNRQAGITLLEIMIASSILVLALVGLLFVITYSSRQNQVNQEVQIAQRAAQSVLEAMSGKPYEQIFKMFNDFDDDGIASPMGYAAGEAGLEAFLTKAEPGTWFDVELRDLDDNETLATAKRTPKLTPPAKGEDPEFPNFARPRCGKIYFPGDVVDVENDGQALYENASDFWSTYWTKTLGWNKDMDGNGTIDADVDMSQPGAVAQVRYKMLPVIVEVKWKGLAGVQSIRMHHIIYDRYNKWMKAE